MVVKACFKNEDYNYFVDKENGIHRNYGDIFMCDDDLAEERIKKGLVKKASKKEELIEIINKVRAERLEQSNGGE